MSSEIEKMVGSVLCQEKKGSRTYSFGIGRFTVNREKWFRLCVTNEITYI